MRIFGRKESRTIPGGGAVWTEGQWAPQFPPSPNDGLQVADIYACVRTLASAAASLPLVAYRRTGNGRVRLDSGRLYDLLRRPSAGWTQANLTSLVMTHLLVDGNAFIGKFRNGDGVIEQVAPINPQQVEVKLRAGSPVYVVTDPESGRESTHGPEDITHVRGLNVDGLRGISPLRSCRLAYEYARGMSESAAAFTAHGFLPAGILRVPQSSQENLTKLAEGFSGTHGGASQMHKIALVSGDVQWTGLSIPADDMQFVQQRELSTREICRLYGVPPWLIGGSSGDSLTYANSEQQSLLFAIYGLRPYLILIEQAFTGDPDLCSQNQYVEYLLDAILRADSATRANVYTQALDPVKGWMSRSEVRELENLDPETNPPLPPVVAVNGKQVFAA